MSVVTTRGTVPQVALDEAALADLELTAMGVRLPWTVLGGCLGAGSPTVARGSVAVAVPPELAMAVEATGRLTLTDVTGVPVADLTSVLTSQSGSTTVAMGSLVPRLTGYRTLALGRGVALVAQRPLLGDEAALLALPSRGTGTVIIGSGPSPDGMPAHLLRVAVQESLPSGFILETLPLHWREPDSDAALVAALGTAVGRPLLVLSAAHPLWRRRVDLLDAGATPHSAPDTESQLLQQWRPRRSERGLVIMFTGLSGAGKSTLAQGLVQSLRDDAHRTVTLLDGDVVRRLLSSDLGFGAEARDLNLRRIGFVAAEVARHHGVAVCAPIAPFAASRQAVRDMVRLHGDFVLVHVATPLGECERRDRKGLYARAREGLVADFTGISSPYEVPEDADLVVDTTGQSPEASIASVVDFLTQRGWVER